MSTYTFTIKLNGGVRLTIGEAVVINSLDGVNADTFYPRKVEYTHFTNEATVELLC